ncbi:MAG: Fe-S cluster assembly protein SufB, partial [Candidatus Nitrosocaldus sp.]
MTSQDVIRDYSKYDFKDPIDMYVYISRKGLSRETIEEISRIKNEPEWMLKFRLNAYETFLKMPMPRWGGDLSNVDFDNIYYYAKPTEKKGRSWDDVPENIRKT